MLSLEPAFCTTTSICLSPSLSPDATLLSDVVPGTNSKSETELNDFNIGQLQLQYESSMDSSLNPMHHLESIDLLHPRNQGDLEGEQDLDEDYAARRMSSSAISSASVQSAHSVHTSTTAASSHSGFSAQGQSLKRTQSPGEYDSYATYDESPRNKRPRPSLSLEPGAMRTDSASPAPTNTTASAGSGNSRGNATGSDRVQLPPIFSALENTSSSAPPTSHGTNTPFTLPSGQTQPSYSQSPHSHSLSQSQGQNLSQSPFPTSNFAFNVSGASGLDLRRGSLPSLYSNSLAARSMQRVSSQGQYPQQNSRGTYGFTSGMSPGPSPLSSLSAPDSNDASGLAGYQFPGPTGMDNGNGSNGSNGSGSTPTPTPATGTGASQFGSGMTPTSSLSSAPSSGFPHTPLEYAHQNQSSYQAAYSQQNQSQKEYDRFAKDYLNSGAEWSSSIARPSSTPSSASAGNTPASASASGAFGFNTSGGLGGLPRISGHGKCSDQQQEWFPSNGNLVLPSPNAGSGAGPSDQQQQQHPQTASLSPSPRIHPSSASSSATAAAAAAAAALNVSPAAAVQAAQVAAQVAARPARRRGKLPKPTTDFLKDWLHRHSDHPYPSEEEKKQLCHATGLSMSQVSNWMINARRRILAPAQRTPQGPTTTVPSFPLGSTHSNVNRTPLGLSPAHGHGLSSSHLSQSQYGMGMNSGLSGMGLGLMGGMNGGMSGMGGMGYQQHHQLHAAQGMGMSSGGGMYQQQQYRQQQQQALGHPGLYDLNLQRRASMPALALHSQAHLSPLSGGNNGNGSLHLYPPSSGSARSSLPGSLPQIGYSQQQSYSPQPGQLSSPAPQRGYVFPPPSGNPGAGNSGDDGR